MAGECMCACARAERTTRSGNSTGERLSSFQSILYSGSYRDEQFSKCTLLMRTTVSKVFMNRSNGCCICVLFTWDNGECVLVLKAKSSSSFAQLSAWSTPLL